MRQFLLVAFATLLVVPALMAQETERRYYWNPHIVVRAGTDGQFRQDSNRADVTVPFKFAPNGTDNLATEIRGIGQIIPLNYIYDIYKEFFEGEGEDSLAARFMGAGRWTVDSIAASVFHNPDNDNPVWPGQFEFYKLRINFLDTAIKNNGLVMSRSALEPRRIADAQFPVDRNVLLSTVRPDGGIQPILITFEALAGGAIELEAGESLMMVYINEFAPAILNTELNNNPASETQQWIGYLEYQTGSLIDTNFGGPLRDPLPDWMSYGVLMQRRGTADTIASAYHVLVYNDDFVKPEGRAVQNFNATVTGMVELGVVNSVRYQYGRDAESQGLGNVTPNPVTVDARIPFSVTEKGYATIEIYSPTGEKVATVIENQKVIPGNYDAQIPVNDLSNGSYLVRMTIGEKIYSSKFTVAK